MRCLLVLLVFSVLAGPLFADGDMAVIRARLKEQLLSESIDMEGVQEWLATQSGDGHWPHLDYDLNDGYAWGPQPHVRIITLELAKAYAQPGSPLQNDSRVVDAISRSLAFWLEKDFRCKNWWQNDIGLPRDLARVLLLMDGELPPDIVQRALTRVAQTPIGRTGQNRVWQAGVVLRYAVLTEDETLLKKARDAVLAEIKITDKEGVQRDFSFHQHGPQMMTWAYGKQFLLDTLNWWRILDGTRFDLTDQQQQLIRNVLLEGIRWSAWRGQVDLSVQGRTISRGPFPEYDEDLRAVFSLAAQLDPEHNADYEAVLSFSFNGDESPQVGHRHFWRSDYAVCRRPEWFSSVRMHSVRTYATETFVNGEIPQGHHLADGAMFVMRDGREFHNLCPVWDWYRIPGVTCRDVRDPFPVYTWQEREKVRGRTDFVGGVSDGLNGIASMHFLKDGIEAKKAWFFLNDGVVCLGAGIKGESGTPLLTTVNQCRKRGDVTVLVPGADPVLQVEEQKTYELPEGVFHDGIFYRFFAPASVTVSQKKSTGRWRSVNPLQSAKRFREDVFCLWINHREADGKYAYMVQPGQAPLQCTDTASIDILVNAPSQQVICAPRAVYAVFHEAGTFSDRDGNGVTVDRPCLLMLEETVDGWKGAVADPTCKQTAIRITVNGMSKNIRLPIGDYAGRSVSISF